MLIIIEFRPQLPIIQTDVNLCSAICIPTRICNIIQDIIHKLTLNTLSIAIVICTFLRRTFQLLALVYDPIIFIYTIHYKYCSNQRMLFIRFEYGYFV